MTMFPTPEQQARSIREGLEITLRAREARIALLEKLIRQYRDHVAFHEGISYLEERHFDPKMLTREDWTELRKIARETE